ncbi:MAG: hypothetical protein COT00_00510 [Candidatus Omnitrophica bacterium CG07_land_8_20_14_0_80_50_8]|nr:MAG: hypothetical protein AUJ71_02975 [Candidatus Omnitrophica bacterium CG1_02_49_16]PIU40662.1 MAG: hypothetical protein COT00_00510 [Candidatus Omnitrophica bacterium CG07_land_8_20_14_0_80_50_8]
MNYDQKERIVEIVFFIALFLCSGALRQVRADDTVSKDPAKHSVQPGDRLDIQVAGEKNLSGIFLSVLKGRSITRSSERSRFKVCRCPRSKIL